MIFPNYVWIGPKAYISVMLQPFLLREFNDIYLVNLALLFCLFLI
jgi:hypothetical protein